MSSERKDSRSSSRSTKEPEVTLEAIRALLRSELAIALEPLKKEIRHLKHENEQIRSVIVRQQAILEKNETQRRSHNLIINGIPEGSPSNSSDDNLQYIQNVIDKVREHCSDPSPRFKITSTRRIGKPSADKSKTFLVTMENQEHRNLLLRNSRVLRELPKFSKVFINADLPDNTRKENARLHNVIKDLRKRHPTKTITRKFGIIYVDGVQEDKFDLKNQLFLANQYE